MQNKNNTDLFDNQEEIESLFTDEPIPLRPQLPDAEKFPFSALGKIMGDAAEAIYRTVQAPDGICGNSILAASNLVTQGYADIILPYGEKKPLSGYFFSIAESGDRKTSVDKIALSSINEYIKNTDKQFRIDKKKYEIDLKNLDKPSQKNRKNGDSEVDRCLSSSTIPEPPVRNYIITGDPTYEGMIKYLDNQGLVLGIFSDEGSRFVSGYSMKDENRLASAGGFSQLWDGTPISRMRGGDGTSLIYDKRVNMHIMIQPVISQMLFGDENLRRQGFLARCLAVYPKSLAGYREAREPIEEDLIAIQAFQDRIKDILTSPLPLLENSKNRLKPKELRLSPEAKSKLEKFIAYKELELRPGGEYREIKEFAEKLPEHICRIAGTIKLMEDLESTEIDHETLEKGLEIGRYYASEAKRIYTTNSDLHMAEVLLNWLKSWNHVAVSIPDICQHGPNQLRKKVTALKIVKILVQKGYLKESNQPLEIEGNVRKQPYYIWPGLKK
jgi:hypothetical protein